MTAFIPLSERTGFIPLAEDDHLTPEQVEALLPGWRAAFQGFGQDECEPGVETAQVEGREPEAATG